MKGTMLRAMTATPNQSRAGTRSFSLTILLVRIALTTKKKTRKSSLQMISCRN
jgi:hypothetical protein